MGVLFRVRTQSGGGPSPLDVTLTLEKATECHIECPRSRGEPLRVRRVRRGELTAWVVTVPKGTCTRRPDVQRLGCSVSHSVPAP